MKLAICTFLLLEYKLVVACTKAVLPINYLDRDFTPNIMCVKFLYILFKSWSLSWCPTHKHILFRYP